MDFRVGDVVNRTFGTITRNISTFLLLAFLLVGIPNFVVAFAQFGMMESNPGGAAAVMIAGTIVSIVTAYTLQGALIHGAVVDFNGAKASLGESFSTGLNHLLPIVGIAILMTLGIMAGMLLLVVPGIILAIMWVVAVPAQVVENKGIGASFSRSRELTKGGRWKIFGLFLIFMVLISALSMIAVMPVAAIAAGGGSGAIFVGALVQGVTQALTAVVGATGVAALYFELRKAKEGIGAEALAAVFE
ncbi:MAG: hypothetical protein AAGA09_07505 [Pseudomonadota bacterium]